MPVSGEICQGALEEKNLSPEEFHLISELVTSVPRSKVTVLSSRSAVALLTSIVQSAAEVEPVMTVPERLAAVTVSAYRLAHFLVLLPRL